MTTPDMHLTLPVVGPGGTLGPEWASELNSNFSIIDAHDHSSGNGAPISSAGISVTTDLPFNSHNATTIRSLRLDSQSVAFSDPSDIRSVYSVLGELYYRDTAGHNVQITSNGSVAGPFGNISGLGTSGGFTSSAVFSNVDHDLSIFYNPGLPAKLNISDIRLYEFGNAAAQPITLKSPSGVSAHDWVFPAAAAAQTGILSISTAGQLSYGLTDGSSSTPGLAFAAAPSTGMFRSSGQIAFSIAAATKMVLSASQLTLVPTGSAGAPAYSFDIDPDIGMYRAGANDLRFSTAGVDVMRLTNSIQSTNNGTSGAPGFSFLAESNTGMYINGAADLRFSVTGSDYLVLSESQILSPRLGLVSAPAYSFSASGTSGMYLNNTTDLRFAVGGVDYLALADSQILSRLTGSAGTPAYSFTADQDSGMYLAASGDLRFSIANVDTLRLSSSQILSSHNGSTGAPAYSFHNASTTGMYESSSDLFFTSSNTDILRLTSTQIVIWRDGLVSSPALAFNNDLQTGIYRNSAGKINFASAGTNAGFIGASGIATASALTAVKWQTYSGVTVPHNGGGTGFLDITPTGVGQILACQFISGNLLVPNDLAADPSYSVTISGISSTTVRINNKSITSDATIYGMIWYT